MNHTAISLIGLAAILVGIASWDPSDAVFIQKTNAMYEECKGTSNNNNNNNVTCTGSYQRYGGITFDDLILRVTELKITHNDTAVKKMNTFPYNTTRIPFLLPFP
jgi:hypothetical protein